MNPIQESAVTLFTFCPNCTRSESWSEAEAVIFKQPGNKMTTIVRDSKENPFNRCCDPLKGKTLTYVYLRFANLVNRTRDGKLHGINIDIIKELSSIMGFKYKLLRGGFDLNVMGKEFAGKVGKVAQSKGHLGGPLMQSVFLPNIRHSNYVYFQRFCVSGRIPTALK